MKAKIYFPLFLLFSLIANCQTVVFNDKLLTQLTKNQAARLASDKLFFDSYEKQRKLYDDINQKIAQVVAIQEYIYKNLKNINSAILQSKKLYYLYQYIGKINTNLQKVISLSAQHPEYSVLISKYYAYMVNESIKMQQEITEALLNENNDFLMDSNDREILLEKIFDRARHIHGSTLYIIQRLQNAKKIPYLYQIPVLQNYVNIDKMIIQDIVSKYHILTF